MLRNTDAMRRRIRTGPAVEKRRKFHNRPTEVDGIKFDSMREAKRYRELILLQHAGEISGLELQPKYPLEVPRLINGRLTMVPIKIRSKGYPNGRRCSWRADFRYQDKRTGMEVVEDVKGHDDDRARFKRGVVEAIFGIEIALV